MNRYAVRCAGRVMGSPRHAPLALSERTLRSYDISIDRQGLRVATGRAAWRVVGRWRGGACIMIQCQNCEHYHAGEGGQVSFTCNPFGNIVEPECLQKWQLLRMTELTQKVDRLVAAYESM